MVQFLNYQLIAIKIDFHDQPLRSSGSLMLAFTEQPISTQIRNMRQTDNISQRCDVGVILQVWKLMLVRIQFQVLTRFSPSACSQQQFDLFSITWRRKLEENSALFKDPKPVPLSSAFSITECDDIIHMIPHDFSITLENDGDIFILTNEPTMVNII